MPNSSTTKHLEIDRWEVVKKSFGRRLRQLRKKTGLKASAIADFFKIGRSTYGKLEGGIYQSPEILDDIQRAMEGAKAAGDKAEQNFESQALQLLQLDDLKAFIFEGAEKPPTYCPVAPMPKTRLQRKPSQSLARTKKFKQQLAADETTFHGLCKRSFEHCLNRKQNPKQTSSTCMFLFGLIFNTNPTPPILQKEAPIQAIETELEHLEKVSFSGKKHNPEKDDGIPQIADEIIDMIRCLFLLAIANGIERFEQIKWIDRFCQAYRHRRTETVGVQRDTKELFENFSQLRKLALFPERTVQMPISTWIERHLVTLGAFSRDYGVSMEQLCKDLSTRLDDPNATTQHSRHPNAWKHFVTFITCTVCLPDKYGAYRALLDAISDAQFNVLASASTTITWNETAKAKFLLYAWEREKDKIDHRLRRIQTACNPDGTDLLVSFTEVERSSEPVRSEKAFLDLAREALREFEGSPGFNFQTAAS